MKKIQYYIYAISTLFTACEYDPSGNNFMELTPPDDFIAVEISLNDIDSSDTIYIYQNTHISIKINSENNDLRQAAILLDGKEYNHIWNNPYNFTVRPDELSEGVHKLTVNAVFSSGTGSLAEMMGMEGYMGEMSWNIRVIHNFRDYFKIKHRTNAHGFLELYWDNAIPENAIEKYIVYAGLPSGKEFVIDDPMQKSFIDYGYVCGYGYFEVSTYLKSGYSYTERYSFDTPTPAIHFEDLGLDQLRVYWDKPFANGRFTLMDGNVTISSGINDTTITIPQIFGRNRQFYLEIRPQKTEYDSYHNQYSAWDSFCQGISLGLPNWPQYAYNATENLIYSTRYDELVAFDAVTLKEKEHVTIRGNPWGLMYGGRVASAPHNSTVAAMTGEETWIFTDSKFINQIIIPELPGNVNTRLSALTSDDRFFVVPGDPGQFETSRHCHVFNVKTGKKIFDFSFTHAIISIGLANSVTISDDGRYFFAASVNGMELFEISGTTANRLYADTRRYTTATFVPNHPDKLLVRANSDIELRQMPNFNLIQKLDVSPTGAVLCNVDPATGNLLYYQDGFLKVASVDNLANLIFEIRSEGTFIEKSSLLNNKLLTYGQGGIVFDIGTYIF